VGGDTVEDTLPVLHELHSKNQGVILAYSVEVDEKTANSKGTTHSSALPTYKQNVEEMIHSIDVAADFADQYEKRGGRGRNVWVALKFVSHPS
jgi:proline dehydrogenase